MKVFFVFLLIAKTNNPNKTEWILSIKTSDNQKNIKINPFLIPFM